MTSPEPVQLVKRVNESAKKSPLKVVSPIIKKYSEHRQGKIKKKLKFPRIIHGGRAKQKKQIKPQLKTILPKTNAGDIIMLEPELLPCALNPQKRKIKEDGLEIANENQIKQTVECENKISETSQVKESSNKIKTKVLHNNKKRIKCLKNVEASLELLEAETYAAREKREQTFAENYLLRVQQRLKGKDENLYNHFIDLICNFQSNGLSACDLYKKLKTLFHSHSDLYEDFVAFLTPEQAVECGVFMDHLLLTTMTDFLNMINIYFAKSPQQIKKIYSVLESLATKQNVTTDYVVNAVLPLLKGNPVLRDYFLQILPNTRPPENFLTDFEEVDCLDLNSEGSEDEEVVETVRLPEVEDLFGGELCPCKCHSSQDEKFKKEINHCLSCSTKFINGKIFIQQGKLLRPARVVFDDYDMNFHRERLAPKLYPKRGKKRHRHTLFKDNLSPSKSCNLSSDEFKSDIEEDDKGRFKLSSTKSPRINRKKSVSPKSCDKKGPFDEPKIEVDFDEKFKEKSVFTQYLDLSTLNEENEVWNENKMEVHDSHDSPKQQVTEFLTFLCDSENQTALFDNDKPLDLPKIDVESDSKEKQEMLSTKPLVNESNGTCEKAMIPPPVFVEKEGSHSPPVISIPETVTPLFSNSKPILSLLENIDSKESSVLLDSSGEKSVNLEEGFESVNQEVVSVNFKTEESKVEDNILPWTIEEDRVILQTLQVEENCEETFVKIGKNIPNRSIDDIKKRFAKLMNMLFEMKAKTNN